MNDILGLAQRYFDLLYTCDVTTFDDIFHPDAQLQTVGKDGYAMLTSARYKDVLRDRRSPASQQAERNDEVLMVDRSSGSSALLKVRALINGTRYCDYLTLLKVKGRWLIGSKTYAVV
jgi:hypothetical protein